MRRSKRVMASANYFSERVLGELRESGGNSAWNKLLKLSKEPGVVNLGQGFPNYQGSKVAREAAAAALTDSSLAAFNQYSMPQGMNTLLDSICKYYNKIIEEAGGQVIAPSNLLITAGATEALFVALDALVGPGDEVITYDPGFPWYASSIRLAGATPVFLELQGPAFAPDFKALREAITPKTKVMLLNTPQNPTGYCYTLDDVKEFAAIAKEHDLVVISDEVYENCLFNGLKHYRISDQPDMFDRTLTICSASKLFSLTGWRVGWVIGPDSLMKGLGLVHVATTYCAPSPFQHGLTSALDAEAAIKADVDSFEGIPSLIEGNAQVLGKALEEKGFTVSWPGGGHFLMAKSTALGSDGMECAMKLLEEVKLSCVPGDIFYAAESKTPRPPYLRFAICKTRETISEAAARIAALDLS
ncbi:unnamed protein product [Chrysoparadoxa australica]